METNLTKTVVIYSMLHIPTLESYVVRYDTKSWETKKVRCSNQELIFSKYRCIVDVNRDIMFTINKIHFHTMVIKSC